MKKRSQKFSQSSKKRGQLTVLIMLSIVIVISIVLYIIVGNKPQENFSEGFLFSQNLNEENSVIRENIFNCVEQTTKRGIIKIGAQGGYLKKDNPKVYLEINDGFLPVYYYEGEINIPTKTEVEESLSDYVNDKLSRCFEEVEFPKDITFTSPTTITAINENNVMFVIDSTITISDKNSSNTVELRDKRFYVTSYLHGMLEVANYMTNSHREDPKYYCLNCISELGYKHNVNIDLFELPNAKNFVEVVIHENITNSPELTAFIYLNKYTGEEVSKTFD